MMYILKQEVLEFSKKFFFFNSPTNLLYITTINHDMVILEIGQESIVQDES